MRVQAYGYYNLVIRIYGHQNVVSFSDTTNLFTHLVSCQNLMRFDQEIPKTDKGHQELSKTFHRLKIRPLLRKLQAFKDWKFFDFY